MADKSETSVGSRVVVALLIVLAAWIVLKWVLRVVAAVATTIVVLGLLVFAAWLFLGRQNRSSK
jgi:FtsH-binding integral membrane protein